MLLEGLIKEFYHRDLPYFPVADFSLDKDHLKGDENISPKPKHLLGFLSRKRLALWASDLGRLGEPQTSIPLSLLTGPPSPSVFHGLGENGFSVPVFNHQGSAVGNWNSSLLLEAIEYFSQNKETVFSPKDISSSPENILEDGSTWLSNMILSSLPWPLYACNVEGKALFFNKAFEEFILTKPILKRSIRHAEAYLLEAIQNGLASSLMKKSSENPSFQSMEFHDQDLKYFLRTMNLEKKGAICGYFIIFVREEKILFPSEIQRLLQNGRGLNDLLDDVESKLISYSLDENERNISHAADHLKVNRSTLQHKMKRLGIVENFVSHHDSSSTIGLQENLTNDLTNDPKKIAKKILKNITKNVPLKIIKQKTAIELSASNLSKSSDRQKTKLSKATSRQKTKLSKATSRQKTKPSKATSRQKTKPSKATDRQKTKPSKATDRQKTKPSKATSRRGKVGTKNQ